jgi:HSP20 family protein
MSEWRDEMFGHSESLHLAELRLGNAGLRRHFWMPAADVYETTSGWIVKLELAGVRPQDISVTVHGNLLRIRGRRRDWILEETRCCRSLEICYEQFERVFELTGGLEHGEIKTEYRDGMLLVKISTEESAT